MSKTLIYLIAIFALWLWFRYGNFDGTKSAEQRVADADKAGSGHGGLPTGSTSGSGGTWGMWGAYRG